MQASNRLRPARYVANFARSREITRASRRVFGHCGPFVGGLWALLWDLQYLSLTITYLISGGYTWLTVGPFVGPSSAGRGPR